MPSSVFVPVIENDWTAMIGMKSVALPVSISCPPSLHCPVVCHDWLID